jgi:hypothetical protein
MVTSNSTPSLRPISVTRKALDQARQAPTVAAGLRDAANACTAAQPALRARLITAATVIDVLVELLLASIVKQGIAKGGRRHGS